LEIVKHILDFWPVRGLLALVYVVLFGAYLYLLIGHGFVKGYIGSGDWKKGLVKVAATVVVTWFTIRALQMFAFWLWEGLPVANKYERVASRYSDLCTTEYQTGENEWQTDTDWHAGDRVCAPLYQRLRHLHPPPTWLFGSAPQP
jgi:hypothetical protein